MLTLCPLSPYPFSSSLLSSQYACQVTCPRCWVACSIVSTCKSTPDTKQPASMVACLLNDFSLSEKWCTTMCVWGWLANATYLIHENAEWHIVCCYGNPYIPSDCQRGSLVERFSSNDKTNMNDQWASACLPRFPLCMRPNDTQDAAAGYQNESMGTTATSWWWSSSSASWHRKRRILNRIKMECDDMKNQFFHLKEKSMKMLFPSVCNEFLHLCHQNK